MHWRWVVRASCLVTTADKVLKLPSVLRKSAYRSQAPIYLLPTLALLYLLPVEQNPTAGAAVILLLRQLIAMDFLRHYNRAM